MKEVSVRTTDNIIIKSEYVKYDRDNGLLEIKENVEAIDASNNIIKTDLPSIMRETRFLRVLDQQK